MTTPYTEISLKNIPGSADAHVDTLSYIPISDAAINKTSPTTVKNIFKMLLACTPIEASVITNIAVNFMLFDVETAMAVLRNMAPILNSWFFLMFSNNSRRVVNYVDILTIANILVEYTNMLSFVGEDELNSFIETYGSKSFLSINVIPKPNTVFASKYAIAINALLVTKRIKNFATILKNLMAIVEKELPGAKVLNIPAVNDRLTKHTAAMAKLALESERVYNAEIPVSVPTKDTCVLRSENAAIINNKSELENAFMDARKEGKDLKARFASYKLIETLITENYRSLFIMGMQKALSVGVKFNWKQGVNKGPAIILRKYENKAWKNYIICTGQFSKLKAMKFCITAIDHTKFREETQNIYYTGGVLRTHNKKLNRVDELTGKDFDAKVILLPETGFYDITYSADYEALGINTGGYFIPIMKKVVNTKYEVIDELHNLDYDKLRQMSEVCHDKEEIILKKINEAKNLEVRIAEQMSKNKSFFVDAMTVNSITVQKMEDILETLTPIKVLFKVISMFDVLEPTDGEGAIISASLGKYV